MQSSEYISFSLSLRKGIRSLSSNQKTTRPFRKSSRQRNINSVSFTIFKLTLGTLRKTRQQRQRHQTKGLLSTTMAEDVHYNSWYISLPSSAPRNNQILCCLENVDHNCQFFRIFYLELNPVVAYSAGASFNTDRHTG